MNKKLSAIICLAAAAFCLFSCKGDGGAELYSKTDTVPADWRNTIAYDGSVYINEETKILYSIDKGEITLWDNGGDGTPLQTLNYDTYYDKAYDTLEFADINKDGSKDITIVYSNKEGAKLYNLWLWSTANGSFTSAPLYRTIYNPTVSEDGKSVSGKRDMGMFGILEMTYSIEEDLSLTQTGLDISNAAEIAAAIAGQFGLGNTVERTGSSGITLDGALCSVFAVKGENSNAAYIAYSSDGQWFADLACIDVFRQVGASEEKYTLGSYCGAAGEAFERASSIYGTSELTVTEHVRGFVGSKEAEAFTFQSADGTLCTVIKAEDGVWYGTEGSLKECYIVSNAGTFEYVKDRTFEFISIYEQMEK